MHESNKHPTNFDNAGEAVHEELSVVDNRHGDGVDEDVGEQCYVFELNVINVLGDGGGVQ